MGTLADAEIERWLLEGGLVVTSSDRAARAFQSAYHRRRRAKGQTAWPAPNILDWKTFARTAWEERNSEDRLLLNPAQEAAVWANIIRDQQHLSTVLPASVNRLAAMAMEAHELLCSYGPHYLPEAARIAWDQDPGTFSLWLKTFEDVCAKNRLLSPSRLPMELIPLLEADKTNRPALRTAGFDRLFPIQTALFNEWGSWQQFILEEQAKELVFYGAIDSKSELEACSLWCSRQVATNPHCRLLVVTQDISVRRGEIERAFLQFSKLGPMPLFEFSLGVPLSQIAVARGAHVLLRWLDDSLEETEVDWLFSSGLAASPDESAELQAYMRALRHWNLQRTQWSLQAFLNPAPVSASIPPLWTQRMIAAQRLLREIGNKPKAALEWTEFVPRLLDTLDWPGEQAGKSADFQAQRRWQQALDTAASLGFDGSRISWNEFLSTLSHALQDTLFAPQSLDAPIQIAGPAESAGLTANAIWFLGADEDSWPSAGSMHPLLPKHVQREVGMPHSSPLRDWEFSSAITGRLTSSAQTVHFSFALQKEGVEMRPSRLISQVAGTPQPMPCGLMPPPMPLPATIPFADSSRIPFLQQSIRGGSGVLTSQSQCPFKAFATARLGAQDWEPAEAGLTAAQRGQLLHAVLHAIWSGPLDGLKTRTELVNRADRISFVQRHVQKVLLEEVPSAVRESMPPRYLVLEEKRLAHVVTEWLDYEAKRIDFTVEQTEATHAIEVSGLSLNLRLDRIDRLIDGSLLVIDYKTGDVSPKAWDLPRPEDVQLPLYAGFAIEDMHEPLGGLVFAKVRAAEHCIVGRVKDAKGTLLSGLSGNSALVKSKLTIQQIAEWKQSVEQLARDFVDGRADVNPREYPRTCERCGLQTVCRIGEREDRSQLDADELPDEEADDE